MSHRKIAHRCVIDAAGNYVDLVQVEVTAGGEIPQHYKLKEGERLVNAVVPNLRPFTGGRGFVRPVWSDGWSEAATPEELSDWETEHPTPVATAPSVEELSKQVANLSEQVGSLLSQMTNIVKLLKE